MSYVDTSLDKSVALMHRQNQIRSELLLRALRKHHFLQEVAAPEVKIEVVEPSEEFKELWFGFSGEDQIAAKIPTVADIKRLVANHFRVSQLDLISSRRMHECARPRMIGMYLARHFTKKSLPEIARRFGRSDHSTTLNAVKRIALLCQIDWKVAHDVAHLEVKLDEAYANPRDFTTDQTPISVPQGCSPSRPHSFGAQALHAPSRA